MKKTEWQKANERAEARREFREWCDSVAKAAEERERILRVLGNTVKDTGHRRPPVLQ
jgi:hypothetical protein